MTNPLKTGFILLIIFIIIHVTMMAINMDFTMSHPGMFLGVFFAGTIFGFSGLC